MAVDFSQLTAWRQTLRAAPARATLEVGLAVNESGQAIEHRAQENAPVLTGDLRDSIHLVRVGPMSIKVVADSDHADYVENGTSKMAPEPYMAPAFDAEEPGVAKRVLVAGIKALL